FGAIQLQRHNSGSACRCTSDHNCKIFVPIKMSYPALTAGMKKRHHTPSLCIVGVCPIPFVAITTAAQGEVVRHCETVFAARNDVVNFKRLGGKCRRAATIFTPPL